MFGVLIESKARRQRRFGGALLSVVTHGALIGGAIVATTQISVAKPAEPPAPDLVYRVTPPPVEPVHPNRGPTVPSTTSVPPGTVVVVPPLDIPNKLPPITAGPVIDDPSKLFITRGLTTHDSALASASSVGDPNEIYRVDNVEKQAVLRSAVRPVYPEMLRTAGIGGRVVVRFVIDTLGRVENESVVVREASHARFENAVRDVLPRLRFTPAEVDGRPVRMLVEMPFEFAIRK